MVINPIHQRLIYCFSATDVVASTTMISLYHAATRGGRINQQTLLLSVSAITGTTAAILLSRRQVESECSKEDEIKNYWIANFHSFTSDVAPLRQPRVLTQKQYDIHDGLSNHIGSSMPTILATSPIATGINVENNEVPTSRRWTFKWGSYQTTYSDESVTTTWLERIGKTFFVITRGVEIALRLSPLMILTPTAVVVSAADSFLKRMHNQKMNILSTSGESRRDDDGDLFVKQFGVAQIRSVYPGQTWASNLAWRYTLYTLQSLGPAFCKLGQW
jgi:hypothetical protein